MLKKCYRLFLGLMVIAGSACVTPTHASSAFVIITNIRAGGQSSAAEEGVVIYNNSTVEVDITHWCLANKSAVKFACVTPESQERIFLPPYSYGTIVSVAAQISPDPLFYTAIYQPSNHTSGAITASADTISLVDAEGLQIDAYSWSSSTTATQQWSRAKMALTSNIYLDTNSASDWQKGIYNTFPTSQAEYRVVEQNPDIPDNPTDPTEPNTTDPTTPLPKLLSAIITELLPNAVGSDTGNEYIELFNPNREDSISLKGYVVSVGPSLEKMITLGDVTLMPGEYKVFSNAELGYTLLNTTSKVSLKTSAGIVSSEVPAYAAPPEGESWALINEIWEFTNQPTPAAENRGSIVDIEDDSGIGSLGSVTPKPCAANQYRSPETNRCRLIVTAQATIQTPCKVGQQRNRETGRCRNTTASTAATECKQGQERSPETNRCRTIKQLASVGFGVKGATSKEVGVGWYIWAAIAGIVLLVLSYGVWEWRVELRHLYKQMKAKFAAKLN